MAEAVETGKRERARILRQRALALARTILARMAEV
jgi:hypothetical protein